MPGFSVWIFLAVINQTSETYTAAKTFETKTLKAEIKVIL